MGANSYSSDTPEERVIEQLRLFMLDLNGAADFQFYDRVMPKVRARAKEIIKSVHSETAPTPVTASRVCWRCKLPMLEGRMCSASGYSLTCAPDDKFGELVEDLRANAAWCHKVTGCSLKNHLCTKAADMIEALQSATLPPDVRSLLLKIADAGESGEPFENWPRYWPTQDEQGGCVSCGAGTIVRPATTAKQHRGDCYFRMAYEILRRDVGAVDSKAE